MLFLSINYLNHAIPIMCQQNCPPNGRPGDARSFLQGLQVEHPVVHPGAAPSGWKKKVFFQTMFFLQQFFFFQKKTCFFFLNRTLFFQENTSRTFCQRASPTPQYPHNCLWGAGKWHPKGQHQSKWISLWHCELCSPWPLWPPSRGCLRQGERCLGKLGCPKNLN